MRTTQFRRALVISDLELVFVNIVPALTIVVLVLIAGREHASPIHLKRDGDGIQRVTRQRIERQLVFLPPDRLFERQDPIDLNRIVPQAGQIIARGVLQDVGIIFRRPNLRAFHLTQEIESRDMVVVIMRRERDVNLFDAELAFQHRQRIEPRTT